MGIRIQQNNRIDLPIMTTGVDRILFQVEKIEDFAKKNVVDPPVVWSGHTNEYRLGLGTGTQLLLISSGPSLGGSHGPLMWRCSGYADGSNLAVEDVASRKHKVKNALLNNVVSEKEKAVSTWSSDPRKH
jgi:hypothetical protein